MADGGVLVSRLAAYMCWSAACDSGGRRAVCKTVGSAYVGSNPTPATTCGNGPPAAETRPAGRFLLVTPCIAVCHRESMCRGVHGRIADGVRAARTVGAHRRRFHGRPRTGRPGGIFRTRPKLLSRACMRVWSPAGFGVFRGCGRGAGRAGGVIGGRERDGAGRAERARVVVEVTNCSGAGARPGPPVTQSRQPQGRRRADPPCRLGAILRGHGDAADCTQNVLFCSLQVPPGDSPDGRLATSRTGSAIAGALSVGVPGGRGEVQQQFAGRLRVFLHRGMSDAG
jgi:hypothetical protein